MYAEKVNWLDSEMEEADIVEEPAQTMAFLCDVERNKKATAAGKLYSVILSMSRG